MLPGKLRGAVACLGTSAKKDNREQTIYRCSVELVATVPFRLLEVFIYCLPVHLTLYGVVWLFV